MRDNGILGLLNFPVVLLCHYPAARAGKQERNPMRKFRVIWLAVYGMSGGHEARLLKAPALVAEILSLLHELSIMVIQGLFTDTRIEGCVSDKDVML